MTAWKRFSIVLCLTAFLSGALPSYAAAASSPVTSAKADILINATTGEFYYAKNADSVLCPASLTKLMTVYMVYEALAAGRITKSTPVAISAHTRSIVTQADASNVPLYTNQTYTVDELLSATITVSACGAACALGEKLGGTESCFASQMTARAKQLGLSMTYYDASGLSNRNRVTARSIAQLCAALVTEYPDVLQYSAHSSITFRGKQYHTTNALLAGKSRAYTGADGLKTGTTSTAGRCLAATALRNGNRMVAVVLGAGSNTTRYNDAIHMMDYGFSRAVTLRRSRQQFTLDGTSLSLHAYTNGGGNYVSARDLSAALSGTAQAFSVQWDRASRTVSLVSGASDAADSAGGIADFAGAKHAADSLIVNGQPLSVDGYIVADTHYYAVRTLTAALGLELTYDAATDTVTLTASAADADAA